MREGAVVATSAKMGGVTVDKRYLTVEVPDSAVSYRLYMNSNGAACSLEGPVQWLDQSELVTEPSPGKWSDAVSYDAVSIENNVLHIDPDKAKSLHAYTSYVWDEPQTDFGPESYWIVELNNPTEETLPMRAFVYGQPDPETGESSSLMSRTLLSCPPGKSLKIVCPIGFKDHPWPLEPAARLSLDFITQNLESPIDIELGNVYVFHRTADVINYLSQYEFTDFWSIQE